MAGGAPNTVIPIVPRLVRCMDARPISMTTTPRFAGSVCACARNHVDIEVAELGIDQSGNQCLQPFPRRLTTFDDQRDAIAARDFTGGSSIPIRARRRIGEARDLLREHRPQFVDGRPLAIEV